MKNNHNKKRFVTICILFCCIFCTFNSSIGTRTDFLFYKETPIFLSDGDVLYVGGSGEGNYSYIQDAIDAAYPGDTIYVYNGTYYEHVVINKTINLIGEDKNTTFIDNRESQETDIVRSIADWVTISGFTVDDNGSYEYVIGFHLCSNNSTIMNCNIYNAKYGIIIPFVCNNTIENNIILYNDIGVFVKDSKYNTISNNTIQFNNEKGVVLTCFNEYNTIIGNNISYNFHGIELIDFSCNDIIVDNELCSNRQTGIYLLDGYNNTIYHNNFINNSRNAVDYSDATNHNNWDNGYPSSGNYWDDYSGIDENRDGIGDIPYVIDDHQDRFPFIVQNGWTSICSNLSFITLSSDGLLTCPAGDGPAYQYVTVTIQDFTGSPIQQLPANLFEFTITSDEAQWYDNLSCNLYPVDPETNNNGEICFELIAGTSIIGNITLGLSVDGFLLQDTDDLACKSFDLDVSGSVNLIDFVMFAFDWAGTAWRSDFNWDGTVNLIDFSMFARHWGHQHHQVFKKHISQIFT